MKKLLALAVLAGSVYAVQSGAQTSEAKANSEFSHNAEFRVRYQYNQNPTGNKDAVGSTSGFDHRFKLGTMFRASESFSANLTLLHNASWGSDDFGGAGGTEDSAKATLDGIGNADNMILVNEAYGSWMVNDSTTIRFGRGTFTMADGSVISSNDWEAHPYAFEGALVTHELEPVRISAWGVKFAEYGDNFGGAGLGSTADDAEANSYGLALDVKALPEFLKMVNIHVIQGNKDFTPGAAVAAAQPGQDVLRYGVTVGGDVAGLDYRVVYAAQDGDLINAATNPVTKTKWQGNMMHAEVGYTIPDFMNGRFHVAYHQDTGDKSGTGDKNETYDSYFYELHGNSGLMDVVKWGNLTFITVGYSLMPADDLKIALAYHMFSRTEKTGNIFAGHNGSGIVVNNATDSDDIGNEWNLSAEKTYEGGFSILGWAGMFSPGSYLKNNGAGPKDAYTQVFLQGKMTF